MPASTTLARHHTRTGWTSPVFRALPTQPLYHHHHLRLRPPYWLDAQKVSQGTHKKTPIQCWHKVHNAGPASRRRWAAPEGLIYYHEVDISQDDRDDSPQSTRYIRKITKEIYSINGRPFTVPEKYIKIYCIIDVLHWLLCHIYTVMVILYSVCYWSILIWKAKRHTDNL